MYFNYSNNRISNVCVRTGAFTITSYCTHNKYSRFSVCICVIWLLCASLIIASFGILRLHPIILRIANRFIYGLFPLSLLIGKVRGVTKDQLRQSMIDLINHLVMLDMYTVDPERILLLTPHCLQESSCVHKVTHDVYNCKQCGRCQVGSLLQIAKEYGCQFIVVTGGTLARMKVKRSTTKGYCSYCL